MLLVHDGGINRCCAALSIGNAGQFLDPPDLPGCAHLCEHMVLSSRSSGPYASASSSSASSASVRKRFDALDFEDWLDEFDGSSNGFTAAGKVCFHFTLPQHEAFPEALQRFAGLFGQETFENTCRDESILRREVRRIDSELDVNNDNTRLFYLLKSFANPNHPFARFGAGNLDSLESVPKSNGVDVSKRCMEFFDKHYVPSEAVLVVISNDNLRTLERLVEPFADKLSKQKFVLNMEQQVEQKALEGESLPTNTSERGMEEGTSASFPAPFRRLDYRQNILVKRDNDDNLDTLSLAWPLQLQYSDINAKDIGTSSTKPLIVAPLVGFVVAQLLGRQGPESLSAFLLRRQWVPPGLKGKPRIVFPCDVTGFQVMQLELKLTKDGFYNRSAVIAAILGCIESTAKLSQPTSTQPFLLPRELIAQYASTARLHGYTLAPRPSDAVELAVDSQTFGLDGQGVGVLGTWPLFPDPSDSTAVEALRQAVASTLTTMTDPGRTIATIIASESSIKNFDGGLVDPPLPNLGSSSWNREPLTNAQYYVENVAGLDRLLVAPMVWALGKVEGDELGPPFLNPLLPSVIRPPRPMIESQSTASMIGDRWKLYQAPSGRKGDDTSLPLPLIPPEPSSRCSFVVQLLSNRPKEATVRQAARSQLWLASFDDDIVDLAELGAPAGLAYDLSFNAYGLRICFRGLSQSLPSYARRFCRRLVQHHARLVDGSVTIDSTTKKLAINQANRLQESPLRKRQIVGNLRTSRDLDAAAEGLAFLNSCDGGVAFSQGDLLHDEAVQLCKEIKSIFSRVATENYRDPVQPSSLQELLYKPYWKPKTSSPLLIPGVALISDACGRVQR